MARIPGCRLKSGNPPEHRSFALARLHLEFKVPVVAQYFLVLDPSPLEIKRRHGRSRRQPGEKSVNAQPVHSWRQREFDHCDLLRPPKRHIFEYFARVKAAASMRV